MRLSVRSIIIFCWLLISINLLLLPPPPTTSCSRGSYHCSLHTTTSNMLRRSVSFALRASRIEEQSATWCLRSLVGDCFRYYQEYWPREILLALSNRSYLLIRPYLLAGRPPARPLARRSAVSMNTSDWLAVTLNEEEKNLQPFDAVTVAAAAAAAAEGAKISRLHIPSVLNEK